MFIDKTTMIHTGAARGERLCGTQGMGRHRSLQTKAVSSHRTYPRRITIADPVPGIAQPRLADTSAFLTWRQPPSR